MEYTYYPRYRVPEDPDQKEFVAKKKKREEKKLLEANGVVMLLNNEGVGDPSKEHLHAVPADSLTDDEQRCCITHAGIVSFLGKRSSGVPLKF